MDIISKKENQLYLHKNKKFLLFFSPEKTTKFVRRKRTGTMYTFNIYDLLRLWEKCLNHQNPTHLLFQSSSNEHWVDTLVQCLPTPTCRPTQLVAITKMLKVLNLGILFTIDDKSKNIKKNMISKRRSRTSKLCSHKENRSYVQYLITSPLQVETL